MQGGFGIVGAQILAPGDPYRSVLYYRMAKLGRGRMPHLGSEIVDEHGLRLMHDWIRRLPLHKDERLLVARLRALDEPAIQARERAGRGRRLEQTARQIAGRHGRRRVTAADRKEAERMLQQQEAARARTRAAERAGAIRRLLSSTSSALILSEVLARGSIPASVRRQVVAAAVAHEDPQVRDLFERFVPDEQRLKRLGSTVSAAQLLALKGSTERGQQLFFKSGAMQCVSLPPRRRHRQHARPRPE